MSSSIAMPEIRTLRKADDKHFNWALTVVIAAAALAGGRRRGKGLAPLRRGESRK